MVTAGRCLLFFLWCLIVGVCKGQQNEKDLGAENFKSAAIPFIGPFTKNILGNLQNNANISMECSDHVFKMMNDGGDWANQMLDAMGKIPAGFMRGSLSLMGSYDQCLEVVAVNETSGVDLFKGQYCILEVKPKSSKPGLISYGAGKLNPQDQLGNSGLGFYWHSCFPSSCTPSDVQIFSNTLFEMMNLHFTAISCEVKQKVVLDTSQLVAIVIFSILGLLLFIGTTTDILLITRQRLQPSPHKIQHGTAVRVFLCFSLYTNALKMLDTKTSSDNLGAINGIRFLSMTWIIMAHTYTFVNFLVIGNLFSTKDFFQDFAFQVVMNGTVSVDVFFFLSGLLLAYVTMKEFKKNKKINWFLYYFHRFWRLTPALGLTILSIFLMPLLGSGPLWNFNWNLQTSGCKEDWWTTLLYINNIHRQKCLTHSWYLANDMQFFVVSPLIIYLLWRWWVAGLIMNTAFLLAATITPALIVWKHNYTPTLLPGLAIENTQDYMTNIYFKPWCRMSTYCVGIYFGFLLSTKRKLKIHAIVQTLLWCLSFAGCMAVVYGTYEWNNGNLSSTQVNALYVATHRTAFALGIAWMTFACCTGYGGIINDILSWKPFIPLGRMTYMAYLFHPYVMILLNNGLRERVIISHYYMVVTFLGFLVISYGVAFITSISIETPFINLEKILWRKPIPKPKDGAIINQPSSPKIMEILQNGEENKAFTQF